MVGNMLLNPRMKYEYLSARFGLTPRRGIQEFEIMCEFCEKKITGEVKISKTGNPSSLSLHNVMFHHKDGDAENNSHDNIQVLCYQCRKHFQYWGMVQRYLEKAKKKPEDLPDCSKVPKVYQESSGITY